MNIKELSEKAGSFLRRIDPAAKAQRNLEEQAERAARVKRILDKSIEAGRFISTLDLVDYAAMNNRPPADYAIQLLNSSANSFFDGGPNQNDLKTKALVRMYDKMRQNGIIAVVGLRFEVSQSYVGFVGTDMDVTATGTGLRLRPTKADFQGKGQGTGTE